MNNQKKNESVENKELEGLTNRKNISILFERLREYPAFRLAYQQDNLDEMLSHLERVLKKSKVKTDVVIEKDFSKISYETYIRAMEKVILDELISLDADKVEDRSLLEIEMFFRDLLFLKDKEPLMNLLLRVNYGTIVGMTGGLLENYISECKEDFGSTVETVILKTIDKVRSIHPGESIDQYIKYLRHEYKGIYMNVFYPIVVAILNPYLVCE